MANTLYDYCRQRFLEAQINWMTDTVKVILVSTSAYTPQTAVHQYLADIPVSARIAGPVTLTAKATTGGAADAADCTFTSVSGATPSFASYASTTRLAIPFPMHRSRLFAYHSGTRLVAGHTHSTIGGTPWLCRTPLRTPRPRHPPSP